MPFDADTIIARRKMRSRLTLLARAGACAWRHRACRHRLGRRARAAGFDLGKKSDHVARIRIEGMITGNYEYAEDAE